MKLTLHIRVLILLSLVGNSMPGFSQEVKVFETVSNYLDFTHNRFGINAEEVYFVASAAEAPPKKISALMFFRDGEMAVIEDVTEVMKNYCPPDKMMKQVTKEAINKSMFRDPLANAVFTQMVSGKTYKPSNGEMVAVFLLGHELGEVGQMYIKERHDLAANLNIKTIIVTVDENYITELVKRKNDD